ncbi:MAG: chorismate synthase [Desulfobulbaceae bacterium]|nr:MAG: chorismate synthase [Desulfobulbaceae bacterium]
MAGNTFGKIFQITSWGESHGPAIGVVVDGCPPGLPLSPEHIQADLDRRHPGGDLPAASPRKEPDRVEILSGTFEGRTTGTPISLIIFNKDAISKSYEQLRDIYRPGHGDITYQGKYGLRDHRGGGRASARETATRVAAGAVANQVLAPAGIRVCAYTVMLGGIVAKRRDLAAISQNSLCCPDHEVIAAMNARIDEVRRQGDSLGGIVEIRVNGCPVGLGEPVFDKLDGELARAMMSIGAVKGVEIGQGFAAAALTGWQNNDPITPEGFSHNNAGGILAGISSGDTIIIRVAVKPIPSIAREQQTINRERQAVKIKIGGRHDISAIPRIIPVCEAMTKLVLADHLLRQSTLR